MDTPALRAALNRLAANHRWTWTPSCRQLLASLPGAEPGVHPAQTVARLTTEQLDTLLTDDEFVARVNSELEELHTLTSGTPEPHIAYCSPEFGISGLIPQYAGGLGVLAGDHLKAASDLGVPLVGVGLFYRNGVFRQVIEDGHQTETYGTASPVDYGAVDTGIVVDVPLPGREVSARVWRLEVGRTSLLLLDTFVDSNTEHDKDITDRLYIGFTHHRIDQEMILGVGGAKALAALGMPIRLHHLNEGHAGFIALELIDRVIEDGDVEAAVETIRPGLVFTTHTPVPAGIDRFDRGLILPYLQTWADAWDVDIEAVWALGEDTKNPSKFNMAAFCLRVAGSANGVSELHGEVSRKLFHGVGLADRIGSVTNGVHARTWTAPHFQTLFDDVLGPTWADGDAAAWNRVEAIPTEALESARRQSAISLSDLVRERTDHHLDPGALIVGFARRFAPYKRATLIMRHGDRLAELLADDERPIHFVFAGKAHPADDLGKSLVARVVEYSSTAEANGRVTFIPDYDMEIGYVLTQGSDIWLNNPIRPREASGTSGQKAVLNGGLNCSILDGWWAEMYDGQNGWSIPASEATDHDIRDDEEAASALDTLEAIIEEYHSARLVFNGRIRHAWQTLGPRVTAARMLRDYRDDLYGPALEQNV